MPRLHPGDAFPELSLTVPGGETVKIPEAFAGQFGVMLFIRGSWCPYCSAQLRAFHRARANLGEAGIRVAAVSVDDEITTAAMVARHGLTFPVGFGADARVLAGLTGAFVNPGPVYLQSAGFVLDPRGKVLVSVYSSGAIGRLVPEDVAGLVSYVRERAASGLKPAADPLAIAAKQRSVQADALYLPERTVATPPVPDRRENAAAWRAANCPKEQ